MKMKPEDWQKFCNRRMERINVHDEIECSKMLRDLVNRYFAIGKKDISSATKGFENDDKEDLRLTDISTDKYVQGWNIGYYMQPVKWDSPKK